MFVMTAKLKLILRQLLPHTLVLLLVFSSVIVAVQQASALELTTRSVRVSSAQPGAPTQHLFTFTVPSTATIGSIAFEYCTNSPLDYVPCVAPVGLDVTSGVLSSQTGNTGFSISGPDTTANRLVLTRAASAGSIGSSTYTVTNIINPTTAAQTSFVRLATFASTDGSGPANDIGAVAFATNNAFEVTAYVPPFLTFCVGVFVTLNCNSVTGTKVDVGELESGLTATANLQFSGATNDPTGFTTYLNGYTMTSGNNIIPGLASNAGSIVGTSQFGLNLRSNTIPAGGLDPVGAGTSAATAGYDTPNSFRFVNGEAITNSPISTDFKLFTATYIINVADSQAPGVYATTMTFTAVAAF